MNEFLMITGAFVSGLLGGFMGLGGGVLLVPFLTLAFFMPMQQAAALSLATVMANSLVSSTEYLKSNLIDLKLVILFSFFASVGAIAAGVVGHYIPGNYLQIAFALILIHATFLILRRRDESPHQKARSLLSRPVTTVATAVATGILSTLLGVGGGIIIIPASYLILNYPMDISRGSSTFAIGIIATAGSVVYLIHGTLRVECAGPIMLGTMAGGWLGGLLGAKTKSGIIKPILAILFVYLAIKMFLSGIAYEF